MKRMFGGCLIVLVLGAIAGVVGSVFVYRAATPYLDAARGSLREWTGLGNPAPASTKAHVPAYTPPPTGELTDSQVQRFARVQDHMRASLAQRFDEVRTRYARLQSDRGTDPPSMTEALAALKDLTAVVMQARRHQAEALDKEGFSPDEYAWVRARVFEAAGIEVARMIDLSAIEQALRDGTGIERRDSARIPGVSVPQANRELVQPYLGRIDEWLPLAFFGL